MLYENGGDYEALKQADIQNLPAEKQDRLKSYASNLKKREPVETDWKFYQALSLHPELLDETDLEANRDRLGDSEFKALLKDQQERRTNPDSRTAFDSIGKDVLYNMLDQNGIKTKGSATNPLSEAEAESLGRVTHKFRTALSVAAADKKAPLNEPEIYDIALNMFRPGQLNDWNKSRKPKILMSSEDVALVPVEDRMKLRSIISEANARSGRANLPISEEDIQTLYKTGMY
jgi:soluble lytic murein transglycosylase